MNVSHSNALKSTTYFFTYNIQIIVSNYEALQEFLGFINLSGP